MILKLETFLSENKATKVLRRGCASGESQECPKDKESYLPLSSFLKFHYYTKFLKMQTATSNEVNNQSVTFFRRRTLSILPTKHRMFQQKINDCYLP